MAKKPKEAKIITRRRKFIDVEIPLTKTKIELVGNSPEEVENKTIKLDLTRHLKGKSVEATVKIQVKENKAIAYPKQIKLMSYFIRRMIRKRISYVEDSFETPSQESLIRIKPFLITRKKVSRVVRKTIRNKARNWIEDYIAEKKDSEIFSEILSNRMQKPLSLVLKKTYPLSLCEIRVLEIIRPLKPEEIPKITKKKTQKISSIKLEEPEVIDQVAELEQEKIKQAEKEIKETQKKATKKEEAESEDKITDLKEAEKEIKETTIKKEKVTKKKESK